MYKGAREALIPNLPSTDLPWNGYNGFGDVEFPNEPNLNVVKSEIAATAMHRFVVQHPKQVTLLCCGPMTNVALALRMYPDFGENVKEIYIMGGNYQAVGNYKGSAEFNFYTDVESAHIALSTLKCPITMCAWESATEDNLQLETVSMVVCIYACWRARSIPFSHFRAGALTYWAPSTYHLHK